MPMVLTYIDAVILCRVSLVEGRIPGSSSRGCVCPWYASVSNHCSNASSCLTVQMADPMERRRLNPSADSNEGEEEDPDVLLVLLSVSVDVIVVAVVVVVVRGNNMEDARELLPLTPPKPRAR